MTKKHLVYFANHIANLRRLAKEHSNMEGESETVMECARECQYMVENVAKKFNPLFDETRFARACQLKA